MAFADKKHKLSLRQKQSSVAKIFIHGMHYLHDSETSTPLLYYKICWQDVEKAITL